MISSTGVGNVSSVSIELMVVGALRVDSGMYRCTANNSIGSTIRNITINVFGKLQFCVWQMCSKISNRHIPYPRTFYFFQYWCNYIVYIHKLFYCEHVSKAYAFDIYSRAQIRLYKAVGRGTTCTAMTENST